MSRWRLLVVLLLAPLLGAAPALVAPAGAATLSGYDVSWPQCPTASGGSGLPLPPAPAEVVVIGLTRGLPFPKIPCLGAQVGWARQNAVPAQASPIPAFPT